MRLRLLVLSVLAACACTRAQGQAAGPGALTPGPHHVVLNGVRFFYSVGGTAAEVPPVVLLHGGTGQGREHFEALGGRLLERELQVIYFDQRGSGQHTTTKGTLQIPYNKSLPEDLIRKIAEYRLREVREREDDAFW